MTFSAISREGTFFAFQVPGVESFRDSGNLGYFISAEHLNRKLVQMPSLRCAGIFDQRYGEIPHEGRTHRRLHAQVGDDPADRESRNGEAAQQGLQGGPLDCVEPNLVELQLVRATLQ